MSGATGAVGGADVTSVTVNCSTNQHVVGGTVSGLAGAGLKLALNGGTPFAVGASGGFAFPSVLPSGATYQVTITDQPTTPWQTCVINSGTGTGTIADADIASVAVACTTNSYKIRGTVSGLTGAGLVLRNNGGDDLAVLADGTFAFATAVASGGGYAVTVAAQPTTPWQTCTVDSGSGGVAGGDVSNVTVTCTTNDYAVGGTVTGLAGTVVLQNNARRQPDPDRERRLLVPDPRHQRWLVPGDRLDPADHAVPDLRGQHGQRDGHERRDHRRHRHLRDQHSTPSAARSSASPAATSCCRTTPATTWSSGRRAPSPSRPRSTAAPATPSRSRRSRRARPRPAASAAARGRSSTRTPPRVTINCSTNSYLIGGTVTGLIGSGVVLQNNGGGDIALAGSGTFTFAAPVSSGDMYNVTVKTQPTGPWQTCTGAANAAGTVTNANVSVAFTCVSNPYPISVMVGNVAGGGLVLQNNAGDNLGIPSSGTYMFATPVRSGLTYAVTVLSQPANPWQTCSVTAPSGTVAAGPVVLAVSCITNTYSVGRDGQRPHRHGPRAARQRRRRPQRQRRRQLHLRDAGGERCDLQRHRRDAAVVAGPELRRQQRDGHDQRVPRRRGDHLLRERCHLRRGRREPDADAVMSGRPQDPVDQLRQLRHAERQRAARTPSVPATPRTAHRSSARPASGRTRAPSTRRTGCSAIPASVRSSASGCRRAARRLLRAAAPAAAFRGLTDFTGRPRAVINRTSCGGGDECWGNP